MRAYTQLATWCTTVALAATTAAALTAAPAAADPPVDTPRTTSCVMLCITFDENDEWYETAWSQLDVTHTPYWITIFNARSGQLYGRCGSGTWCYGELPTIHGCDPVIAYIGSYTATMPPRIVVQTSSLAYPPYC